MRNAMAQRQRELIDEYGVPEIPVEGSGDLLSELRIELEGAR
jgi:hypothetical protein